MHLCTLYYHNETCYQKIGVHISTLKLMTSKVNNQYFLFSYTIDIVYAISLLNLLLGMHIPSSSKVRIWMNNTTYLGQAWVSPHKREWTARMRYVTGSEKRGDFARWSNFCFQPCITSRLQAWNLVWLFFNHCTTLAVNFMPRLFLVWIIETWKGMILLNVGIKFGILTMNSSRDINKIWKLVKDKC